MRVLSVIIAHPLRKVCGATNAGRELSAATAELTDLELAVMWDRDETARTGRLPIQYVRCTHPFGFAQNWLPRSARVPLYDSRIPELIRDGCYDLVHLHNMIPTFAAGRVARACQAKRVPYVISTHGFFEIVRYAEINGFGTWKSKLVDLAITKPFRRIVRGAAAIFALSDCEQELLAGLGVAPERIHIVTNGVNPFYLERPTESQLAAVRAKFHIGSEPLLLYMGSLHAYKGVGVFLRSLAGIRQPFQAVVAGGLKDDGQRRALLQSAHVSRDVEARVAFTGSISDEDLRALYHLATVFVYPTSGDTLPLVVLEAMASGLPVVSTTVGGVPFAVRPDTGMLVPPETPEAVSHAVNTLLDNPALCQRMGASGRARVHQTFRWGAAAQCALEGYRAVLSANRPEMASAACV